MRVWMALLVLLYAGSVWPAIEVLRFDNAEQEQRYHALIKELRCLVCQNQNLADSNADLARDLREKAYEMIRSGSSDSDVVKYMVDRYGEFVLYRPRLEASTALLWAGPFLILLVGLWVIVALIRRRRGREAVALTPEQRGAVKRLLDGE